MEDLKNYGLVKYILYYISHSLFSSRALNSHFCDDRSIGISNFGVNEIEILLASAKIKPAVNQVRYYYLQYSPHSI